MRHRRLTNLNNLIQRRDENLFNDNLVNNKKFFRLTQTQQGKRMSAQINELPPQYERVYQNKYQYLDENTSGNMNTFDMYDTANSQRRNRLSSTFQTLSMLEKKCEDH